MPSTVECPFCGQTIEPPDMSGQVQVLCPVCNRSFVVRDRPSLARQGSPSLVPSGEEWYLAVANGTRYGPVAQDVIISWIREGRISSKDLVWRQGMATWVPCLTTPPFSSQRGRMT